jgi:hypothetical protein
MFMNQIVEAHVSKKIRKNEQREGSEEERFFCGEESSKGN